MLKSRYLGFLNLYYMCIIFFRKIIEKNTPKYKVSFDKTFSQDLPFRQFSNNNGRPGFSVQQFHSYADVNLSSLHWIKKLIDKLVIHDCRTPMYGFITKNLLLNLLINKIVIYRDFLYFIVFQNIYKTRIYIFTDNQLYERSCSTKFGFCKSNYNRKYSGRSTNQYNKSDKKSNN